SGLAGAQEAAKNIGAGLKAITVQDVKKAGKHKLTDWLKLGLQFLGRRQIVDVYGDVLPLAEYDRLAAQMEADKNDVGAAADELARRWGKLPDEGKLADLMHDATLAQIDADSAVEYVPGDDLAKSRALKAQFAQLSPEAQKVYREARDHYRKHHAEVRQAITDRIMRSELREERRAELLKRMDADFFRSIKGVYFPLARFGQYVVVTKDETGKVASVSRAETMAEAEAMRQEMVKAFPAKDGYQVGRVILSKEFIAGRDMVGRGFMSELFNALDEQQLDPRVMAELEDTLGQLYLSSLPDLSWAKHGIHRKGTPGFSNDARRAFAQNTFHGARYLAKLKYGDQMQAELDRMQKHVDEMSAIEDFDQPAAQRVVDEMNKRHEAMMNPKSNPLSTALTSFGFVYYLGISPAAAMVNLSQTPLVAYPVLGAKWGFRKAGAALMTASKETMEGKNDLRSRLKNPDEIAAYDEAVRTGVIDVTMAHDLAGIAQGEDAKVMWKIRPVMRLASYLFHHAERFNRQVTFLAAYRLARDAGAKHDTAYSQAVKATYDGHFDYSAGNRPRVMQGNVAKVVLLFKQYAQNMIYTIARNAYQSVKGESPEVRREARKVFGALMTMHAAAAGVLGLPMVGTLLTLASALGGSDDEPWDAEVALRNMLADTFGAKPAEVIARGFSRLTPWDISGRVGLDKLLLPDVNESLEGQRWAESFATAMLGPVIGMGVNAAKGAQKMADGDYGRGLEDMLPIFARNPIKA
ncbi:MAG TPA: PLxRFG domain-containing protein, partial [Rubrivivax sp.]|nr:PLxRFG domain-containing protein [Rubrivivax sp.]